MQGTHIALFYASRVLLPPIIILCCHIANHAVEDASSSKALYDHCLLLSDHLGVDQDEVIPALQSLAGVISIDKTVIASLESFVFEVYQYLYLRFFCHLVFFSSYFFSFFVYFPHLRERLRFDVLSWNLTATARNFRRIRIRLNMTVLHLPMRSCALPASFSNICQRSKSRIVHKESNARMSRGKSRGLCLVSLRGNS